MTSGERFSALFSIIAVCTLSATCLAQPTGESATDDPASTTATPAYPEVEDALIVFRRGNLDGALKLLQDARTKHEELPPADVMLARFCFAHKQADRGKQLLERAVANAPEDPEAYVLLANFAQAAGNLADADSMFERSLEKAQAMAEKNPRRERLIAASLAGLALVDERRQLWPQAEQHLLAWSQLDPENPGPVSRRANVLFQQQKYDDARAAFAQLGELVEKTALPEIQMGLLFEQAGERDQAKAEMQAALTKQPEDLATRLAVANWALYAGDLATAQANVDKALQLDPDAIAAKLMRGILYRFQNKPAEAEQIFRAVHSESPTNFDATNHLALALAAQEDNAKLRQALEYAQLNARAHRDLRSNLGRTAGATLAWVQLKTGNQQAARKTIEQVLKSGQFPPQAGYYAAEIYRAAGANELAKKLVGAAVASPRDFPEKSSARELSKSLSGE